jgi:hypothetical protein
MLPPTFAGVAMFDELVGKRVEKLLVNSDRTVLVFECEGGERIGYYADGDCCSESWFNHITGLENVRGTVEKIEEKHFEMGGTRQDSDQVDMVELVIAGKWSSKGFQIEFRNSSNGYYGGSADLIRGELPADLAEVTAEF